MKRKQGLTIPAHSSGLGHQSDYLRTITLYSLITIAVLSPILGGMHHTSTRLLFSTLILGVCGTWLIVYASRNRNDDELGLSLSDIAAVALLVIYCLGIFRAATVNGAINTFLTWSSLFALFWAWRTLKPNDNEKRWLLNSLLLSALAIGLWGLMAYVHLVPAGNSLAYDRISSGLLYPNATACMLMVGLLLSLLLGYDDEQQSPLWTALYRGAAILLVPAFLLTLSRGAWLAMFVAVPAVFYLYRGSILKFLSYMIVLGVSGLLATAAIAIMRNWVGLVLTMVLASGVVLLTRRLLLRNGRVVLIGLCAVVVGLAGYTGYALSRPNSYALVMDSSRVSNRDITFNVSGASAGQYTLQGELAVVGVASEAALRVWTVVEGTKDRLLHEHVFTAGEYQAEERFALQVASDLRVEFVVEKAGSNAALSNPRLVGSSTIKLSSLPHRLLPYSFASRVSDMSGASLLNDVRFVFYRDGLKLFVQAPILGQGGGAWGALYNTVQSYLYGATHIHSDPYDVLLEVGLLGLLCFCVFWVAALYYLFRSSDHISRVAAIVVLAFLIHSLGDVLFAFPALYVVCFSLLGSAQRTPNRRSRQWPVLRYVPVVFLVCALIATTLWLAALEFAVYTAKGQSLEGLAALRRATAFNPWNVEYKMALGNELYTNRQTLPESREVLLAANRFEPENALAISMLGQWYAQHGEYEEAFKHYWQALALQPMNIQHYEYIAFAAAEAALDTTLTTEQRQSFAQQVLAAHAAFKLQHSSLPELFLRRSILPFTLSTSFHSAVGQAQVHLGSIPEAVGSFRAALDNEGPENTRLMASCWMHRIATLGGDTGVIPYSLEDLLQSEAYAAYWTKVVAATHR